MNVGSRLAFLSSPPMWIMYLKTFLKMYTIFTFSKILEINVTIGLWFNICFYKQRSCSVNGPIQTIWPVLKIIKSLKRVVWEPKWAETPITKACSVSQIRKKTAVVYLSSVASCTFFALSWDSFCIAYMNYFNILQHSLLFHCNIFASILSIM